MFYSTGIFVILGCVCLWLGVASATLKVHVKAVDLETIDDEYLDAKVTLDKSTGDTLINVDSTLKKDLGSDLFQQVHIQKKVGSELATIYKSDIINKCHFMENRDKYPILKLLYADFDNHGNLLQKCPVKAGKYYLKGYKFVPRGQLEDLITPGEYCVHMILMKEIDTKMRTIYSIKSYSEVEKV